MGKVSKPKSGTSLPAHAPGSERHTVSNTGHDTRGAGIISNIDDSAVILLETDGTVRTWNKGAKHLFGYDRNQTIAKNFALFFSREEQIADTPGQLLEAAQRERKVNHKYSLVRRDGSRFQAAVTISAIQNSDGEVTGFVKQIRDLTKVTGDKDSNMGQEINYGNEEDGRGDDSYRRIMAEIRDYAFILLDQEGNIVDWNNGAEVLEGYPAQEVTGKNLRLLYSREDRDHGLPEKLLQDAKNQGSASYQGRHLRKDGTTFWGYTSITAHTGWDGEIWGYSCIIRNFPERAAAGDKLSAYLGELQRTNEQLRRSEERYHRMIDEVQDYAIIFLNVSGEIENWNAGAQNINGYTAAEVIGSSFTIFYTPEDLAAGLPVKLLREASMSGRAVDEGYRVRKDGTRFWASVVITALHDSQNRVIGYSKVTRDLTGRKEAEQAMDQKNRALEQANAQLSSFAFVASHDLKEPLRKIQVFTSRIVETESLSEKSTGYVDKILKSASRMQTLIEELLAFSKMSAPGEKEMVDLNQVITDVRNDLELAIADKHATITSGFLPTISGTTFQLHQLFFNLFSNSLKFAKMDVDPVISIEYEKVTGPRPAHGIMDGNKYHCISITDNGIGFSQDQASKIFDVFYRLHSREMFEGTGIGLAIVKRVVENHNGVIATEGKPGQGAKFFVYFPWE